MATKEAETHAEKASRARAETQKPKAGEEAAASVSTTAPVAVSRTSIYGKSFSFGEKVTPSFLQINATPKTIDKMAKKAIQKLKGDYKFTDEQIKQLIKKISNRGWTNDINNVTKRLNRMNLGHAGTHVLAATYAHTLNDILFGKVYGQAEKSESRKQVPDEKVKDTVGLAQEILFKQDEDEGPLEKFAGHLADIVMKENNIKLGPEITKIVVNELKAQF